jgi:hypothetical protein
MLVDLPRKTRFVERSELALVEVVGVRDTGSESFFSDG